ncbi:hypothetical protein F5X99DRAFT_431107, partial [Biscogniauxia marginata]
FREPGNTGQEAEPFYDDEWGSELGFSLEKEVFGFCTRSHPPNDSLVRGQSRGVVAHHQMKEFPYVELYMVYPKDQTETRACMAALHTVREMYVIPTLWISAFLTEKFWTECVHKYGKTAFRPPRILSYNYFFRNNKHIATSARRREREDNLPELDSQYSNFLLRWQQRRAKWHHYRSPWFDEYYELWQHTPWSYINYRASVDHFCYHHASQHVRTCSKIALTLLNDMHDIYRVHRNTQLEEPALTIYYLIGLLMFASMPLNANISMSPVVDIAPQAINYFASQEARPTYGNGVVASALRYVDAPPGMQMVRWPTQLAALNEFNVAFGHFELQLGAPRPWLHCLQTSYKRIKALRQANPALNVSVPFMFSVPEFDPAWAKRQWDLVYLDQTIYTQGSIEDTKNIHSYISPKGSPIPDLHGVPSLAGGHATPNPMGKVVPSPQYFLVGEVGNHRVITDAWVIHPDGTFGHDVYQISDLLKSLGASATDYHEIVKTGLLGPELITNEPRADFIRSHFKSPQGISPIGKLYPMIRPEEMTELNGKNGAPLWVSVGPYAFDLTHFKFSSVQEQQEFLARGGRPIVTPSALGDATAQNLVKRLEPHYLGRDATKAFLEYHDLDIMKDYDITRVGYLVPVVKLNEIHINHIVIHELVFDILNLQATRPDLYEPVKQYGGNDATAALSGLNAGAGALFKIYSKQPDCIVASVDKTTLPDIPGGEVAKHNDPNDIVGAWVTVDNYVYNVGDLMRFHMYYEHQISPVWAGGELDDPVLANWLATNFEARRIGRLINGPAWPEPDIVRDELVDAQRVDPKGDMTLPVLLFLYLMILAICWGLVAFDIRNRRHRPGRGVEEGHVAETGKWAEFTEAGGTTYNEGNGGRRSSHDSWSSWTSSSCDSALYTEERRPD